ncbi:MAG: tyrosyl-tRNA synthetase [Candidatus Berkelbacteria bacterium Licking1014_96]|uniref:Tyrosine--tRNA ligase n=1 Tax=Candidatus Berkelbacteria bacterium Licking1014_96 TaxID=2017149 RepID=A0A554LHE7_9BACT|nr:MAG: tyrosyl-tRNA synthetase [Candidatus Berkelbacteria bacterium Licking1014_96]
MNQIEKLLTHNVVEVIEKESLDKKLKSGKKLRIKIGADPTAPDLHLGHVVVLDKLKEFQDLGHQVIFLIGDFTARIGDPSGRSKTRPTLSEDEIKHNAQTYFEQVGKILDIKKVEIRYNSEWYQKMSVADFIKLSSNFSLWRISERDDFEKRRKAGIDVGYHEGAYSIMQAYDSVELKADVEIGGTDQKFNLLAGRSLMKKLGQTPQEVITLPLLIGLDGKKKMSKSLSNYIGIAEEPNEMFGKVMSISDKMMIDYFKLATNLEDFEIREFIHALKLGANPKEIKERLAIEIVKRFYDEPTAEKARERFSLQFGKKEIPEDIPEANFKLGVCENLPQMLFDLKLVKSKSEAKRLVEGGGVKIDGAKIEDIEAPICVHKGMVIQVGKRRFLRIK